jgi:hypothetical protein
VLEDIESETISRKKATTHNNKTSNNTTQHKVDKASEGEDDAVYFRAPASRKWHKTAKCPSIARSKVEPCYGNPTPDELCARCSKNMSAKTEHEGEDVDDPSTNAVVQTRETDNNMERVIRFKTGPPEYLTDLEIVKDEVANIGENVLVFWTPRSAKFHASRDCASIRSSISVEKSDDGPPPGLEPCKRCSGRKDNRAG